MFDILNIKFYPITPLHSTFKPPNLLGVILIPAHRLVVDDIRRVFLARAFKKLG